jgi:hypothetical protein
VFNFGLKSPFKYQFIHPGGVQPNALNEPDCLVKGYYYTCVYLMEALKRFMLLYFEHADASPDYRLLLGCLLFDYLEPLYLKDPYLLSACLLPFLSEIGGVPEMLGLLLDIMALQESEELVQRVVSELCDRGEVALVLKIVQRGGKWGDRVNDDLEKIYAIKIK